MDDLLRINIDDALKAYWQAPSGAQEIHALRDMLALLTDGKYPQGGAQFSAEVYDARRESLCILRAPRADRLRNPSDPEGCDLREAVEAIELISASAASVIRAIAAEIGHQEIDKQRVARHIVKCSPVRQWGESLSQTRPFLSRSLIRFAAEALPLGPVSLEDLSEVGLSPDQLADLGRPGQEDLLVEVLVEIAVGKGF